MAAAGAVLPYHPATRGGPGKYHQLLWSVSWPIS